MSIAKIKNFKLSGSNYTKISRSSKASGDVIDVIAAFDSMGIRIYSSAASLPDCKQVAEIDLVLDLVSEIYSITFPLKL